LPDCEIETIGIRAGEKLHEVMVPQDDSRTTLDCGDYYVIQPSFNYWKPEDYMATNDACLVAEGFEYSSETNDHWMSDTELQNLLREGYAQ
jgi:UDP-N-acetylglucosamine 4,6-dehydratase/5-epimerase